MQRWKIKKNTSIWLCKECLRNLSAVIMLGTWDWVEESNDVAICCDRCKCNEITVKKYGKFRRIFRYFAQNHLKHKRTLKAYRRAIY